MKISFILILIFLISCSEKKTNANLNLLNQKFSEIILTGFDKSELKVLDTNSSIPVIRKAYYYGEATDYGNFPDSIELDLSSNFYVYSNESSGDFKYPDGASRLRIYVDTSKSLPIKMFPNNQLVSSYPVYLYNLSKEAVYIGKNDHLNIILEAKDTTGLWHEIEFLPTSFSEEKLDLILLPENYFAVSSCFIYSGDFETEMRITFDTKNSRKSNIFRGSINYEQLIKN